MKSQSVRGFAKQALTAFVLTGAALAVQAQTTLTFGGSDAIGSILDKQNISFTKCVNDRGANRLKVNFIQGTSNTQTQGASLARNATATDAGDHVELVVDTQDGEGVIDQLLVNLVGKVFGQFAAIDDPTTGARNQTNAGNGLLATTGSTGRGSDN